MNVLRQNHSIVHSNQINIRIKLYGIIRNLLTVCLCVVLAYRELVPKDGGWAGIGEKRGGEEYIPPIGWIGYGLKVIDYYIDNTWLGKSNCQGEWCVAYIGVGRDQSPEKVNMIIGSIIRGGFKPSFLAKAENDEDLRHPGKKCGRGVYCSPDINYAEAYAGITELDGEKYKCVLMVRVNPEKIRQSEAWPKEYILEASSDEIRPYRILLKKSI